MTIPENGHFSEKRDFFIGYWPKRFSHNIRPYGTDHTIQKMIIGTHTSNDEQNYL